jgi:hypothetical protein
MPLASVRKQQRERRHMIFAATRSQITPGNGDCEPQTEQTIVGRPPRNLQPERMDRGSWFGIGMTFAKKSPAWCATAEEYPTAYLDGAGLRGDPKGPLFRTIGRGTGKLTRTVLPQANAYAMTGRRAAAAGIATKLGNHSSSNGDRRLP